MKSLQRMNGMDRQSEAFKKARSSGHRAAIICLQLMASRGEREPIELSMVLWNCHATNKKKTQDALEFSLCGEFSENFYSSYLPAVMRRVTTAWDSIVSASKKQSP